MSTASQLIRAAVDRDQRRHLRTAFVKGWEPVPNTARLCIMNLDLHGIHADPSPVCSGADALAAPQPVQSWPIPPFAMKSSIAIVADCFSPATLPFAPALG